MKCHKCSQNRATVHIVDLKPDEPRDYHFCESCASKLGLITPFDESSIEEILKRFGDNPVQPKSKGESEDAPSADAPEKRCPECGFGMSDLEDSDSFGCENDFELFRDEIRTALDAWQKAHVHCGKTRSRNTASGRLQRKLSALENQLADAVKAENYELAAKLRDRIRDLK